MRVYSAPFVFLTDAVLSRKGFVTMGLVAVVTSGKGGAGKSTVTAGLGHALAQLGKRVLLIDTDAGLRSLDIMLGIDSRAVYDLADIFSGRCEPSQAVYAASFCPNLYAIPAPSGLKETITPRDMTRLCQSFAPYYDVILVDCPAGVGEGFQMGIAGAERALVVTTPDVICARDAGVVAEMLRQRRIPARLIINRLRPRPILKGLMPDIDEIIDTAGIRLIGVLPEDDAVPSAMLNGKPLPQKSNIYLCFQNIARRLYGQTVPLAPLEKM